MGTANTSAGAAASSAGKGLGEASLALLEDGVAVPVGASGTPVVLEEQQGEQGQQPQQPQPGGAAWWLSRACCVHPLLIVVQFIFSGAFCGMKSRTR